MYMSKRLCALCLISLLVLSAAARPAYANHPNHPNHDERGFLLPAPLVNELDQWVEHADFWRLVTRAEYILEKIEINENDSNAAEAWLCGGNQVCLTAGLRRALTPAETHAAIAHEIGHIVIPRPRDGHAQLWETQCDLLAAALLRDAETVKDMLYAIDRICHNCRDDAHLAPYERIALLEYCAALPLEKISRLDALRQGGFALPLSQLTDFALPKPPALP